MLHGMNDPELDNYQDVAAFFDGWALYQKLLDGDAMFHQELYRGLINQVADSCGGNPLALLDLGCGNAAFMQPLLAAHPGMHYCGVDLSAVALELARAMLDTMPLGYQLIQADMLQALRQLVAAGQTMEVIFSGYALHHLQAVDKSALLQLAAQLLVPGGRFIIIDMFMANGETRSRYLQAVDNYVRTHWSMLSAEEADAVMGHISAEDFPETPDSLRAMATAAGFAAAEQLICRDRWFQLWVLQH